MNTHAIPAGFHTVTPYLILDDLGGFLDFATEAFGAEEVARRAASLGQD